MARHRKQSSATKQFWIGYCRKSTDTEDKQVHSLQDQETMIAQYYERLPPEKRSNRPLKLLQEARSAYHPGRPVFGAIMRMADANEVYGLIVVHPNRVSRNHADSGAIVQRLVEGRICCLATTSGQRYTASDSNAIFMLTLENAMSWKDSRDKGERILQAMRLRAAEGKPMGQVRAGYRIVYRPDGTKEVELVPNVAPMIRRLFELAATGSYSLAILTSEARHLGLRSRRGQPFVRSAIHALLRDPLYKGYIRFDGIVARGRHAPIVDEALWQRVQVAMSSRWQAAGRPKDLGLRELFVFGSLLRCPRCGWTLRPYRVKGKYVYYECKNSESRCQVCVPQPVLVVAGSARRLPAGLPTDPDMPNSGIRLVPARVGEPLCYPLAFRGPKREIQSPHPVSPQRVHAEAPPSLPRVRAVPVPPVQRYYEVLRFPAARPVPLRFLRGAVTTPGACFCCPPRPTPPWGRGALGLALP